MPTALTDDGTTISYRVEGTGPADLVLLHSFGSAGSEFSETVAALDRERVRAIIPDLRGHGSSGKPAGGLDLDRAGRDVLAVTDAVAAQRFVVAGVSMGAKIAQYLAVLAPERLAGLVLVASPPAGQLPVPDFVRDWVDLAGDGRGAVQAIVEPYLHRPVPDSVLARYAANWERIPRRYLEATVDLVATSFSELLVRTDVPVLAVSGAHDPLHSTQLGDVLDRFPDAATAELDAGSEIPAERPAELAQLLGRFTVSAVTPG